jgi:peptide methionine sulfoxide reductase msrA/msrB
MNKKLLLIVSALIVVPIALWATISSSINNNSSFPVPEMNWDHHYTWWVYSDYDSSKLSSLSGDIVLFFHADRCPTCQQAEKNFLASGIPARLTILKVDYDKETELKKKYAILTQTSFVYIKNDGNMITRWVGWLMIDDILSKVNAAKWQDGTSQFTRTGSNEIAIAYFAGGCFRCMEWPFESLEGVKEVTNWYIWGSAADAHYDIVSSGKTQHREAVEVKYDPALIHYDELLDTYRRQIDPTDAGGQFADRWSQYHTAIYYSTESEHQQALSSKKKLEESHKFNKPIVVEIVPTTPFYPAEVYHQDYYKKNADHYNSYKKWSGREDYIHDTRKDTPKTSSTVAQNSWTKTPAQIQQAIDNLSSEQKKILFEWGTEPAFHNAYRDNHEAGIYVDVIDGTPLFSSTDKFDSGTGRPSFSKPIDELMINDQTDTTAGMIRTEIKSSSSNGHLWHVFDDGLTDKGGQRYCINSAALRFIPLADLEKEWYGIYKRLFTQ